MKNIIYKYFSLAMMLLLALTSCDDRELITIDAQGAPMVMDLSSTNLLLDQNFPGNTALTVSWSPATLSVPVELKYRVEISSTPTFENSKELTVKDQSQTFASFTTKELNEASKEIGLTPFEAQKMYFRVTAFVGSGGMMQQSKVTEITITPYLASPTYPYQDLFLVGASTAAGWDNTAGNMGLLPMMKTADPMKYTFTGFFKKEVADAGFKIIKVKGSWEEQYGAGSSDGTLSTDGGSGNLQVPADGYYKLSVNIETLTYTIEPVTVPTTTYTNVSIIGTVNGNWDTDTQLTQSSFDSHVWTGKGIQLSEGEFKFRANNAWDISWGTNAEYFGTASTSGANIPVTAEWTYDIYFNDATGNYTLIPVK